MTALIDWDRDDWGKPGTNVHRATTDDLGDHGRHCDENDEESA